MEQPHNPAYGEAAPILTYLLFRAFRHNSHLLNPCYARLIFSRLSMTGNVNYPVCGETTYDNSMSETAAVIVILQSKKR